MATTQVSPSALQLGLTTEEQRTNEEAAKELLGSLVQTSQYVGEVFSISYETAVVQIHDDHRMKVGGIPGLSFLIATRLRPGADFNWEEEDSSLILLRVMDAAPLPNQQEAERLRAEAAQRVADVDRPHWDDKESMDAMTAMLFGFAGVRCRVIGTFYLEKEVRPKARLPLRLAFGNDLSNYYPNRGLKVYKPNGNALARIVNFRDSTDDRAAYVPIGAVRYASTNRSHQGVGDVKVEINPRDLLTQKTALFGITRIGKSNTTKVILKSVFELRYSKAQPMRVGQIVFDPNGEYANENVQDMDGRQNPGALKNVWMRHGPKAAEEVLTYGIKKNTEKDPDRKLMLLNFFGSENLQIGKEIIDEVLETDPSKFIRNFCQVRFDEPSEDIGPVRTRFNRRVLAYRALLAQAGFTVPGNIRPDTKGLFNKELLEALEKSAGANADQHKAAARMLRMDNPSWQQIASAFSELFDFISDAKSGYKTFNQSYMTGSSDGSAWADEDLMKILEMLRRPNGARQVGEVAEQHTHETARDYVDDIYDALKLGKLVIVDQSSGHPELNKAASYRIITKIFMENLASFTSGEQPPEILVYAEEAHTILPAGSELNLRDYWVRTAKEGAKCHIGMVYATQEVSSIQENILKNTTNWFIGHLNNTDETKVLVKYEDFADFEGSIRRASDKGFVRMKTLSNRFVVPIQVYPFTA